MTGRTRFGRVVALLVALGAQGAAAQAVSDPCSEALLHRNYLTVEMEGTGRVPGVGGCGRLAIEWSPFGIAVTPDGHVRYRLDLHLQGLDRPRPAAEPVTYVAWAVSPDLDEIHRIGALEGGRVRGTVWLNQYLVVVTAEAEPDPDTMTGPIVMRGRSPTGWIEPYQHHDPYGTGMPIRR